MSHNQDHSELVNKVITGVRWAAVLRMAGQSFSWLSTLIVIRFLSPTDYGLNSMLQSPLEVIMCLTTLGLDIALVQSSKLEETEIRSVFGWLLVINGVLFLAYFFGGTLLANYFKEPRLDILAKILALIFLLVPFRVIPNALLDRELKFKLRAQVDLSATICATLLTLGMAVMGAGVLALVLGVIASRAIAVILLMVFEPWFVKPSLHYATAHRLMVFGGLTAVTGVVGMMSGAVLSLIAGRQLGAELLGIYAVSAEFAMWPLSKVLPVMNLSLVPAFSKFQSQRDVATHYWVKGIGFAALVLVPAMIGMACIADAFVHTILGDKWSDAAVPLALLSIMMLLRFVTQLLRPVMTSMGRPDLSLKSYLFMLVVLPPAALVGVRYGVFGLVVALLVTEIIWTLVTVQLSKKVLDISYAAILRSMRPALLSSAIMAVCVLGARYLAGNSGGGANLLLGVGVGAVSYYLALRLLFPDKLQDTILLVFGKRFVRFRPGK